MSNMSTNRNDAKAKDTRSANKLEVNQNRKKFPQEEFVADFDFNFDAASADKTGSKQPVSERTAWN